jgi:release factor glutamine methyltransferase
MAALRELLLRCTERLKTAGVDSSRLSSEVLLAHAMNISRNELVKRLLMSPEVAPSAFVFESLERSVARREAGEPVAYLTGVKEFYGRDFAVSPATLVPRPDTETLVEEALSFAANHTANFPSFIDLGTGSGAIAVTMALELPAWRGMAVDISEDALRMAKKNAATLGAANLDFCLCDFTGSALPQGPYDMVLANPPYVSEEEYAGLSQEVARYEPKNAFVPPYANSNGLEYLFAIMEMAERLLKPQGLLLMEMGCTQGEALLVKAKSSNSWINPAIVSDLAGQPRVFKASLYGIGEF